MIKRLVYYQVIHKLITGGNTYKEICEIIKSKFNIKLSANQISFLVYNINHNLFHKPLDKIIILDNIRITELFNYCVEYKGVYITFRELINYFPDINITKFEVNKINFHELPSQESLLYTKYLLKLYHLNDNDLLNKQLEYYKSLPEFDYQKTIDSISNNFDSDMKKLISDIKMKYNDFLINTQFRGILK